MKKTKSSNRLIIKIVILLVLIISATACGFIFKDEIESIFNKTSTYSNSTVYEGLTVYYLNVGQGDCSLICFPDGKKMMVDAGTEKSGTTIVNFIKENKLLNDNLTIDYLLLTHSDSDHIGGTSTILNAFQIKNIFRPKIYDVYAGDEDLTRAGVTTETVLKQNTKIYHNTITSVYNEPMCNVFFTDISRLNNELKIFNNNLNSKYELQFYSPVNSYYDNTNDFSPIFTVNYNNKKFMFTGDASSVVEKDVVSSLPDVDFLKIGHHGSKHSSCKEFINAVQPNYSFISVGKNSYGHPNEQVLNILSNANSVVYRTDENGTIVVNVNKLGDFSIAVTGVNVVNIKVEYVIIGFDFICAYLLFFVEIKQKKTKRK